jgi:ribosomal protein S18 acetylase RimI-like enzyme
MRDARAPERYIPRAQRRLLDNWVDIVLTVVSIIQGLAFNDLIILFPPIYAYTISTGNPIVLAHFLLSLALLLRVFQTYVTAALDYDDWQPSFVDVLIIFAIGFVQYFIFAALTVPRFDVANFYERLSIAAFVAFAGYIQAYLRLKEDDFPSYQEYRREQRLQIGNTLGIAMILAICIFVIFGPIQSTMAYTVLGGLSAIILVANLQYSLAVTFSARRRMVRIPQSAGSGILPSEVPLDMRLQIRPAIRDDVLAIDVLVVENFGYIYSNLFDTSDRLTKKIFRRILLAKKGRHALGYRSFMVATVTGEPGEEYVVGLLHLSNPAFQTRSATLRSLMSSLFVVLRLVGIRGVFRTISNLRAFGDLSSTPSKDELHINYIAVADSYRQHGVGAALMRHAKDTARAQSKSLVSLDAREANVRGQRFFEASGFLQAAVIASKSDAIFGQGARIRMVYSASGVEQSVQTASQAQ